MVEKYAINVHNIHLLTFKNLNFSLKLLILNSLEEKVDETMFYQTQMPYFFVTFFSDMGQYFDLPKQRVSKSKNAVTLERKGVP